MMGGHTGVWQLYDGEVKALRDKGMTLQQIGDKFGVTRERIRQVLDEHYGTTEMKGLIKRNQLAKLIGCPYTALVELESQNKLNPICRSTFVLYNRDEAEKAAMMVLNKPSLQITLFCNQCGAITEQSKKYVEWKTKRGQKYWFCSRKCLGEWAGSHYGFVVHPENCGKKNRKFNWDEVCRLRITGLSYRKISEELEMSVPGVYYILRKSFDILPAVKRVKSRSIHESVTEKECIGCGAIHTRRSLFCSVKCYDRIKALVRYYEGTYRGSSSKGRKCKLVATKCSVCGVGIMRPATKGKHFCDKHLMEFRKSVNERIGQNV